MDLKQLQQAQKTYLHDHRQANLVILKEQLKTLKTVILECEEELYEAFRLDFHKPKEEVFLSEIAPVLNELDWFIKHLNQIHKVKSVKDKLWFALHRSYILRRPYGICLIYSPYNYPFNLAMIPLIGAIALNNTVLLKPASSTPHVNQVINKIIQSVFLADQCCLVDNSFSDHLYEELYDLEVDLVFFTGSERVGRQIYTNYAKQLIPVFLELGGKCPVIIDEGMDINLIAKRLVWAKMVNNGQTCISPDYVIVHESQRENLIAAIIEQFNQQYPQVNQGADIAYTINQRALDKLHELLDNQKIIASLNTNVNQLPLTLVDVDKNELNSKLMTTEIFGPILPIIAFNDYDDIYKIIDHNPNPLATYVFTKKFWLLKDISYKVSTGAVVNNDLLLHFTKKTPFGGIKNSGLGKYHKWASVDAFSHQMPIVQTDRMDINQRYAPYSDQKIKFLKKVRKFI